MAGRNISRLLEPRLMIPGSVGALNLKESTPSTGIRSLRIGSPRPTSPAEQMPELPPASLDVESPGPNPGCVRHRQT